MQLQLLVAAVSVLCVLCHGNHSNQAAAAAEGLIDALTSLAAAAMGARLETAGKHGQLLAGMVDCPGEGGGKGLQVGVGSTCMSLTMCAGGGARGGGGGCTSMDSC